MGVDHGSLRFLHPFLHDKLSTFGVINNLCSFTVFKEDRLLSLVWLERKICEDVIILKETKWISDLNELLISLNKVKLRSFVRKFHKLNFIVVHWDVAKTAFVKIFPWNQASIAIHLHSSSLLFLITGKLHRFKTFSRRNKTWHVWLPSIRKFITSKLRFGFCKSISTPHEVKVTFGLQLNLTCLDGRDLTHFVVMKFSKSFVSFFVVIKRDHVVANCERGHQISQVVSFVSFDTSDLFLIILWPLRILIAVFLEIRPDITILIVGLENCKLSAYLLQLHLLLS